MDPLNYRTNFNYTYDELNAMSLTALQRLAKQMDSSSSRIYKDLESCNELMAEADEYLADVAEEIEEWQEAIELAKKQPGLVKPDTPNAGQQGSASHSEGPAAAVRRSGRAYSPALSDSASVGDRPGKPRELLAKGSGGDPAAPRPATGSAAPASATGAASASAESRPKRTPKRRRDDEGNWVKIE